MRTLLSIGLGITLAFTFVRWDKLSARILTHNPPATHPDCRPKYRIYRGGVPEDVSLEEFNGPALQ